MVRVASAKKKGGGGGGKTSVGKPRRDPARKSAMTGRVREVWEGTTRLANSCVGFENLIG